MSASLSIFAAAEVFNVPEGEWLDPSRELGMRVVFYKSAILSKSLKLNRTIVSTLARSAANMHDL